MSNATTATAIFDNLITALQGLGIEFEKGTVDLPSNRNAGRLASGEIFFNGIDSDNGKSTATSDCYVLFRIKVSMNDTATPRLANNMAAMAYNMATIFSNADSLNIGAISTTKDVGYIETVAVTPIDEINISQLEYTIRVNFDNGDDPC